MSSAEAKTVNPCAPSITISYLWCITRSCIKPDSGLFSFGNYLSLSVALSPSRSLSLSQFNPYNEKLQSIKGSDRPKASLSRLAHY